MVRITNIRLNNKEKIFFSFILQGNIVGFRGELFGSVRFLPKKSNQIKNIFFLKKITEPN
jgi:hypothetical protein